MPHQATAMKHAQPTTTDLCTASLPARRQTVDGAARPFKMMRGCFNFLQLTTSGLLVPGQHQGLIHTADQNKS